MAGRGRILKIVTVGDGAVGKTSLLVAYTQGAFDSEYTPTVFENYAGDLVVDNKKFNFTLWDTAGQEGYDRCRVLCYPGANTFLICFSVNDRKSFNNLETVWLPEVRKECGSNIPTVLVGTKSDLRNTGDPKEYITKAEGKKLAKTLNMYCYVECSAKEMTGLDDVFLAAVRSTEFANAKSNSCLKCVIL